MASRWVRWTAVASVLLVAAVAAICSYSHMQHLAERSGEQWRSLLVPLSVDGMLVAATLAIVDRRRARQPAGWVPWLGLTLGILASLAANVAAAHPDLVSRAIAAWPPLALAVAIETLVVVLRGPAQAAPLPGVATQSPAVAADAVAATSAVAEIDERPPAPERSLGKPATDPDLVAKTREVLATDPTVGRPRLAAELGVSDHQARRLLAAARNGHR